MNRQLIIPNLHVILIHYPLGLFLAGLLMELAGVMWRKHPARAVGRWLLLLGGLSMIPTALSGVYALHDVAFKSGPPNGDTWALTVAASSLTSDQWHELLWHTWMMSAATGVIVATIVAYLAMSDRLRKKLYLLALALLLASAAMMSAGAWFAGEAVYRFSVAVESHDASPTSQAAERSIVNKINTAVPPLELHVIFAGFAIAVGLAAVGLSIRKITSEPTVVPQVNVADALVQSLHPPAPATPVLAGRFWIVASAVFILTALLGWYFMGSESETFNPRTLWRQVMINPDDNHGSKITRSVLHVSFAGALVLLPLIMAGLAKWAPRRKLVLSIFTALLIVVIAAQLWMGVLLLYDGSVGRVTGFN